MMQRITPLFSFLLLTVVFFNSFSSNAQSFTQSDLDPNGFGSFNGVTALMYGPDGRLYVAEYPGLIKVLTIQRNSSTDYEVIAMETLTGIQTMADHNDDGTTHSSTERQVTGITVVGTAINPVVYVTSSDFRVGAGFSGGSGDIGLDTNSGVITRFTWNGGSWEVVDLVRGLPRSEENHSTNGLEFATINGIDYLIVAQGGNTNGGAPSDNFVFQCEYALSGAVLSIDLTALNALPILNDNARSYIYDLPTLDDPTRANVNGITDPNTAGYNGIDVNDPFGGNDGLNQAVVVPGGPVQIFSPGYRNAYDLTVTQSGALYVTDNGANQGWGGFPVNEGDGSVTNDYDPAEPGSQSSSNGEQINNEDHLQLVTTNIQTYTPGSYYGGHPNPTRANPNGAGLYTAPGLTGNVGAVFRTQTYDPNQSSQGSTNNTSIALPANWPPVQSANGIEGDWRGPGIANPDGPVDGEVTIWDTNTNGMDEYTATNFGGAMQGNLLATSDSQNVRRVELNAGGTLQNLDETFLSGLGGWVLGITCNSDTDNFPGTIWAGIFSFTSGKIVVFEPQDFVCIAPGQPGYDGTADYDNDGYTNQDEVLNGTDICNGGSQPTDYDKSIGGILLSDLIDLDDDADGILDANDSFQLGDISITGSDAFTIPIYNDLFNEQQGLGGIFGLGLTGLMNNGNTGPNWLDWLDIEGGGPNPDDVLGGAIGLMTSHMTSGTALGAANTQDKAYQYGVQTDASTGVFTVSGNLVNLTGPLRLYGNNDAIGGELGHFIGDGTQSNYIKIVLTTDGITALQEINDIPQAPINVPISVANRPTSDIVFYFVVDPSTDQVDLEYAIDNGTRNSIGTITAQGSVLSAIQQANQDLAVGLIGTSNTNDVELEGTWDFLNVVKENQNFEFRINAGGSQLTANGSSFLADQSFNDGKVYENSSAIVDPLYITERSSDSQVFSYNVPVENGEYNLILHFAEIYWGATGGGPGGAGLRVFDVNVEGDLVLDNYDIFADVGAETPVTKTFEVSVDDGILNIDFSALSSIGGVDQPKVSAIEILSVNIGLPPLNLNPIANRSNRINDTIDFGVIATGGDPNSNFTYQISGQPGGIQIEPSNGLVFGTIDSNAFTGGINNDGVHNVVISVEKPGSTLVSTSFVWTITNSSSCILNDLSDSNLARFETLSQAVGDKLYVIGGWSSVNPGLIISEQNEIYDTTNDTWSFGAPMPVPVTHMGTTVVGDEIWSVAGFAGDDPGAATNVVQVYNTVTDTWRTGPNLPIATGSGDLALSNNKLHYFGGLLPDRQTDIGNHYVLDLANESAGWSTASPLPNPRNHFSAASVNGIIYAIGGQIGHDVSVVYTKLLHSYNPTTDQWTRLADLPTNRSHFEPGTVVHNGKIIIVGGETGTTFFDDILQFDPQQNLWTELCTMPQNLTSPTAKVFGDRLIVAGGGINGFTNFSNSTRWLQLETVNSEVVLLGEMKKWHAVSLMFTGPETSENASTNPFLDYRLNVLFTSPTGNEYLIPGFYAADGNAAETSATSGDKWMARFSPDEIGEWTYETSFRTGSEIAISTIESEGNAIAFDGASGTLTIGSSNKYLPDNRIKGRLDYVGERYLKFQETDTYFLKAGTDSPENMLAYSDFDNTVASKDWAPHVQDWQPSDIVWQTNKGQGIVGAINYLESKGMNSFSFLTMNVIGDGKDVWPWSATSHSSLDGNSQAEIDNRLRYDVSKLEQWEKVFEHSDAKGMFLNFKTQETENDQLLDGGQLGTQRKLYYRELIARFGHHLALNWNLGEEYDIYNNLSDPQNLILKEYISYFNSLDAYKHPIVVHTYPFAQTNVYNTLLGPSNDFTGPSMQSFIDNIHQDVVKWVTDSKNAGKPWVVSNDEQGGPEIGVTADSDYTGNQGGVGDNRDEVRHKALWGTLMGGGAGVEYYFGYQTGETDLTAQDFRSRANKWDDAKLALDFFIENVPFWNMESHDELVSNSEGYCFAEPDENYLIYLPSLESTTLDLTTSTGSFLVQWFDPVNGGTLQNGTITNIVAGGMVDIGAPITSSSTDWVALITKISTEVFNWTDKQENESYEAKGESSFVQAGDKFYILGGLESQNTYAYDYTSDSWSNLGVAPLLFNHFQPVEHQGLIWVIGAFKNWQWPNDQPSEFVWIFNPADNSWIQGPAIPEGRVRGSSGVVVHNDKFYILGGSTNGHNGGYVPWLDEFDPASGQWRILPDAPRPRDHFYAAKVNNSMYAVGGRLTGGEGGFFGPDVAEVDIFDFVTETWNSLPEDQNLPTPRVGAPVAFFQNKIMVMGGEIENAVVYGEQLNQVAVQITEGYDISTNTWSRLSDTAFPRHGTNAIVSGEAVYIASGAGGAGAAPAQQNMEFYGIDAPAGQALIQSNLVVQPSLSFADAQPQSLILEITGGNTGLFVRSMEILGLDAEDFEILTGNLENQLLSANTQQELTLSVDNAQVSKNATLVINYGASSQLSVMLESIASTNPIVDAGSDQNIQAPINSAVLTGTGSDPDGGAIDSYEWTQVVGPSTAILIGANTSELTVNDLVEGTYTFRLTVVDDEGEIAFDEVIVTVTTEPVGCTGTDNLALDKTSSQSSQYGAGQALYANDGNLVGGNTWGSSADLQHTTNEFQPWWQVDLGDSYALDHIDVYNRTNGSQQRLNNFYVLISESPFTSGVTLSALLSDNSVTKVFFDGTAGSMETLSTIVQGRYVRVQLSGTGFLHMAEVEVYGCPAGPDPCDGISVLIDEIESLLDTDSVQQLTAVPSGGVWSGDVSSTGIFDPSQGPGTFTVSYTYTSGECVKSDTSEITVTTETVGCNGTDNLALDKTSSQSSQYGAGQALYANDGNLVGGNTWGSSADLQHTTNEFQPWWQVDLGDSYTLDHIDVYNRTNGSQQRLNNFYVLISESPFTSGVTLSALLSDNSVTKVLFDGTAGSMETLSTIVQGRYVRVQLSGSGFLHMAEVEVYGCPAGPDLCDGISVSIDDIGSLLDTDSVQQLTAVPSGGVWSGDVSSTGIFDPSQGPGTFTVSYTYTSGECVKSDTSEITVTTETVGCNGTGNLARNQSSSQSSQYGGGQALYANDGNQVGGNPWGSAADLQHTTNEFQPWWQVDLGDSYALDHIDVYNRTNGSQQRLNNFYVLISESPFTTGATLSSLLSDNSVTKVFFDGTAGSQETLSTIAEGRYVRVQLSGSGFLHMSEVEVYGCPVNSSGNGGSLSARNMNQASLSPNPAISITTLSFENPVMLSQIQVFDIMGRLVMTYENVRASSEGSYILNVNEIATGTYFIRSTDDTGVVHQKKVVIIK